MNCRDDPQAIVEKASLDLYYTGRDNGNTLAVGAHRVRAVVRNSARRSTRAPSRLTRLTSVAGSAIIRSDRDGRHETGVEPGV